MNVENLEGIYELSPLQEGMLFHSLYTPGTGVYVVQLNLAVQGELVRSAWLQAWQDVVQRHAILRTAFFWEELDKPLQVVYREAEIPCTEVDWRGMSQEEQVERLNSMLEADRLQGFEMAEAPLLRMTMVRRGEQEHQFVLTFHHLLLDGWSLQLVLQEFWSYYDAHVEGRTLSLRPARRFEEYILWLQAQDLSEAEAFWREQLRGFSAPNRLELGMGSPSSLQRVEEADGEGFGTLSFTLSRSLTHDLLAFARANQVTLNTLVQGAWALFLQRYCGDDDLVFGITVSGRPAELSGVEEMVGMFINTLPLRVQVPAEAKLSQWLTDLQQQTSLMRQYEYSPLLSVQEWSELPREQSLFETLLVFENFPAGRADEQEETRTLYVEAGSSEEQTGYPLTLVVYPAEEMALRLMYAKNRFDLQSVQQMARHLQTLLQNLIRQSEEPLRNLSLLSEEEREHLLFSWNNTAREYPRDQPLHRLFEQQVVRTPERVALSSQEEHLTYAELNRRANAAAHLLQRAGVQPGDLVGLCMERAPEMIVGLLAILKAGGAYVPLDPAYPAEPLAYMVRDAGLEVVVTQAKLQEEFSHLALHSIALDGAFLPDAEDVTNLDVTVPALETAYVCYTSGSTGHPKGVIVPHRAVARLVLGTEYVQFGEEEVFLQIAPISFDAATFEIWGSLLHGARLVLFPSITPSLAELGQVLVAERVSTIFLTSGLFQEMVESRVEDLRFVRQLLAGGDIVPARQARRLLEACPNVRLFNGYGPTECTTFAITYEVPRQQEIATVPIGRPIANTEAFVLDPFLQPVPIGVTGELYLGGDGVALGYLHRPELTCASFIPHPFPREQGEGQRLYRTGDLVRRRADGEIEFVGRRDQQVKIRGYRIELGEVECVLAVHPSVQAATVLSVEDGVGGKRLVAFLVAPETSETNLRCDLQARLPAFMIPSVITFLDAMPLTANGKVDRNALLAQKIIVQRQIVPPRDQTEATLVEIFADVLGTGEIGVQDSFFERGGHSLSATRVISKVRVAFDVELPLRALFDAPTVEQFARRLGQVRAEGEPSLQSQTIYAVGIQPQPRSQKLPLSFSQQRLWFLDRLHPEQAAYNIPVALRCKGNMREEVLEHSLQEIVRRHEALRTVFVELDGEPLQVVTEGTYAHMPMEAIDLTEWPVEQRLEKALQLACEDAERPFDLQRGPLFRYQLVKLEEMDHLLLLNMHHIVSDGWSLGVLESELFELYAAICAGREPALPELPVQYADYAIWQQRELAGTALEAQLSYWRQQLDGELPILQLPTDRPRPSKQTFRGARHWLVLPQELADELVLLGQRENATLFMTLLAALQTLLYRYTGLADITVGSPIAGRNRQEIEGLIGFFVNTLVLRTDLSGQPTFRELLVRVRETALQAFAHQDVPFEKLVEELNPPRDGGHTPLFQVMFALQNAQSVQFPLPDLEMEFVEIEGVSAKFDLTVSAMETGEGLQVEFLYNQDLFDEETIARMSAQYQRILEAVLRQNDCRIGEIPLLSLEEQDATLVWGRGREQALPEICLHHLFEAQAMRTPEQIALELEGKQMSYGELNRRVDQVTTALRSLGIGRDRMVGLYMDRSFELIIGMLGTLKAGGCYVPLDPSTPPDRLLYMMEETALTVVLTQEHLQRDMPVPTQATHVLVLDSANDRFPSDALGRQEEPVPVPPVTPDHLAYVIFTSGSTGLPKGVLVEHRGLVNLAQEHARLFQLDEPCRCLQFASFQFDFSVTQVFAPLLSGATLVLLPREHQQPGPELEQRLRDLQISVLMMTPGALAVLSAEQLPLVHTVVTGGETPSADVIQRWSQGRRLISLYGVTEASVFSTAAVCEDEHELLHIGEPIANTQVYLFDENRLPVPLGIPGEIYIGGVGVARGYLNRPDLNSTAFVTHGGEKLYRTGDLASRLPSGKLKFLGRRDLQVKLRGFRIELGEIESVLAQAPGVRGALVLAREERLTAYVLAPDNADVEQDISARLRRFLQDKLPEQMVPSAIVPVREWPLTSNGKIDATRLPAPDSSAFSMGEPYLPPRDSYELGLVHIWQELLGHHPIGVRDNFFQCGGHSLLAVRLMAQVHQQFGVELPLSLLFQEGTVEGMAAMLRQSTLASSSPRPIALQPHGEKTPLFFVHPGGGGVFCYRELAAALGADQPFYALQAAGLEEGQEPLTDLRDMAASYLHQIRTQQPEGPYHLGGWSMGGVIAFEMAQQLRAAGEEVALLALVDSYPDVLADATDWTEEDLLLSFLSDLAEQNLDVDAIQSRLHEQPGADLLDAFYNLGQSLHLFPAALRFDVFQRLYRVFQANVTALVNYVPQKTVQPFVVFQAAESITSRSLDAHSAWQEYAEGTLEVQLVEGHHFSMMQAPHVQQIASHLCHYLQTTQHN